MCNRRCLIVVCCLGILLAGLRHRDFIAESATPQADKKEATPRDTANDPLPAGAIARLGAPHKGPGAMIAFLSDCRTVLTAGPDKKVFFWHACTGKAIRSLDGEMFLAVSSDGKIMASRTDWKDKTIRLFDLAAEKQMGEVPGSLGPNGRSCGFSPDNRYLAVSGGTENRRPDDPPLCLWEVSTRKLVRKFDFRDMINAMAFSPGGKYLATVRHQGKPGTVKLWDVATGNEVRSFEGDPIFEPMALSFSPDSKLMVGVHGPICIWDVDTGKIRSEIYGGDPKIGNLSGFAACVTFSPNGKTMAVGAIRAGDGAIRDGTRSSVYLFETATGRKRAEFDGGKTVLSVAFSPCGLMLGSAASDSAPLTWDVTGQILANKNAPRPFAAKDLDACWNDLAGGDAFKMGWVDMRAQDAAKAWQAICALTIRPEQAVAFLNKRLPATPRLEPKRMAQLQADLENGDGPARDRACKELAEIGPPAIAFLQELAASGINADAKQRIEKLLGEPRKSGLLAEELRCQRAVEILEYIGTPPARELLRAQAGGEPALQTTRDAKAALDRLAKRPVSPRFE